MTAITPDRLLEIEQLWERTTDLRLMAEDDVPVWAPGAGVLADAIPDLIAAVRERDAEIARLRETCSNDGLARLIERAEAAEKERDEANAAFIEIVRNAVPAGTICAKGIALDVANDEIARLREFAEKIVEQTCWGLYCSDLGGGECQELALRLGIIKPVPGGYDPEKHHPNEADPEPGDPWFCFAWDGEAKA